MVKILVVDDEEMIRYAFDQFLKDEGYDCRLAPEADKALEYIVDYSPDIVFLDYRLPGIDGLELLEKIHRINSNIPVVFMTAFGAMDVVIKAMQMGAYEYLTKPLDLEKIRTLINRIMEGKRYHEGIASSEKSEFDNQSPDKIVGNGPAMQEIFKLIGLLTTQDVTVLITGESGVGKELVARAIHENGPRRDKPFLAVNCGAMPETLIEAEMFGYEKGAFTGADKQKPGKFEAAGEGTIFLDEIGELQPSLQVKLLRVLQERSFERIGGNVTIHTGARVIAASNKDLNEEVREGRFRRDLFYRLHLINIQIPPLRERREDIPLLVEHFIKKANIEMNRNVRGITEDSMDALKAGRWSGNVRELENFIKRAMVLCREDVLPRYLFEIEVDHKSDPDRTRDDLIRIIKQCLEKSLLFPGREKNLFEKVIGQVEKTLILEALAKTDGNQMRAASLLDLNRSTLRKKIKDYGI
jgi:nitrogen regulation protein NR(I)